MIVLENALYSEKKITSILFEGKAEKCHNKSDRN